MMQKRMRLMITTKWSYLGTGEGPVFATRSMISSIMFCTFTVSIYPHGAGRMEALVWSIGRSLKVYLSKACFQKKTECCSLLYTFLSACISVQIILWGDVR